MNAFNLVKLGEEWQLKLKPEFLQQRGKLVQVTFPIKEHSWVKKAQPILSLESSRGLIVVNSPLQGLVHSFSQEAADFPECVGSDDPLIVLHEMSAEDFETTRAEREKSRPKPKLQRFDFTSFRDGDRWLTDRGLGDQLQLQVDGATGMVYVEFGPEFQEVMENPNPRGIVRANRPIPVVGQLPPGFFAEEPPRPVLDPAANWAQQAQNAFAPAGLFRDAQIQQAEPDQAMDVVAAMQQNQAQAAAMQAEMDNRNRGFDAPNPGANALRQAIDRVQGMRVRNAAREAMEQPRQFDAQEVAIIDDWLGENVNIGEPVRQPAAPIVQPEQPPRARRANPVPRFRRR